MKIYHGARILMRCPDCGSWLSCEWDGESPLPNCPLCDELEKHAENGD